MMRLNELGISSVNSIRGNEFNGQISFPVFMKPISGRGSRGAYKIDSNQQFKAYFSLFCSKKEEILVQPLLTGTEYTVGVLCNNKNDLISISSKRIIQKRGITLLAVTENNHKIDELAKRIVKELKPGGPFNIQLMITPNDEIKIFEINPRFSTTSILDYEAGIDLVSLYIQFKDRNYDQPIKYPTERIRIHRRWESLFYDEK
jgi:carbamoyl-phosphate synthase large subunit